MGPEVYDARIRPSGVNATGSHSDFSNYFLIMFIQDVATLVMFISLLEASTRLMMSRW